jgi:hypothetical protein
MEIEFKYKFDEKHEIVHICREEDLSEIIQSFRLFLLGVGFHPTCVNEHIQPD